MTSVVEVDGFDHGLDSLLCFQRSRKTDTTTYLATLQELRSSVNSNALRRGGTRGSNGLAQVRCSVACYYVAWRGAEPGLNKILDSQYS